MTASLPADTATVVQRRVAAPRAARAGDPPAVELRGVTKRFGTTTALESIDLTIAKGEFFSLLGPSGCGKTTTLNLIGGFESTSSGTLLIDGQPVQDIPAHARPVNTVFQSYALFPHMSVADNVEYGMRVKKVGKADRAKRRGEALEMVRLAGMDERKPSELSGGQRQRVALARSIVNRPRVLLLDEPLGALDLKLREQMQVELKTIQTDVAITFVYVTHDQDEALTMSDRIAVFEAGKVEQVGTPAEVYEQPKTAFVAGFVGVSNLLERDGKRFTIRPEKIHLLEPGASDSGLHSEAGRVADVSYAGSFTRYLVNLDSGGELQVVRQNLETSSADALEQRGRQVTVGWRPEHAVAVTAETTREEESHE